MPQQAEHQHDLQIGDWIARWVNACQRRAGRVVLLAIFSSIVAALFLADNLRIDTDTENMISSDLAFRQNAIMLDQAFPELDDNLLVVLEAPDADVADFAVRKLADAMRTQPDIFVSVFAPETEPFLRTHGFLYMPVAELESLATRLAAAQPFLGTLWGAPNLEGLASMLMLLVTGADAEDTAMTEAAVMLNKMASVAEQARVGKRARLIWSEAILGAEEGEGRVRRLIQTRPKLDYRSLHPAEHASDAVYSTVKELALAENGITVRLTGSAALESDELKSVEVGMGLAGVISLSLVVAVLMIGLRSPGVMLALFVTLLVGLLWTAAFAIAALGSLNLISVAFAVLFVGLSVDFGIHFALRVSEHGQSSGDWTRALSEGGRSVGASLLICAITTAIAFFSFLPTNYIGLAELGLIAGVGMFVALFCNLTILPALLRLIVKDPPDFTTYDQAHESSRKRAWPKTIVAVGILSAVVAAGLASGARFDFDPMNLKDPKSPSVVTLFDLMDDGIVHPYSAEILTADIAEAEKITIELQTLQSVDEVRSLFSLVPENQEEKLAIIDRMALFLGPAFFVPQGEVVLLDKELLRARDLAVKRLSMLASHPVLGVPAFRLKGALDGIDAAKAKEINTALFGYLPSRLGDLAAALDAGTVDTAALPESLTRRYLSNDGKVRLDVLPAADLRDEVALRQFVSDVTRVAPDATGAPIIIVEAGNAVLEAFGQALIIAVAGIGFVLWVVLRRVRDVLLVFAPVCVAALWTLAVSALMDIPFNFANVIVLPLLFGLSVDFGIHIVLRQRNLQSGGDAMTTTTPRAVLLSALTTLGSFGSIVLSGHPGTASMGMLLCIAIVLSLISILIFLPALMSLVHPTKDEA